MRVIKRLLCRLLGHQFTRPKPDGNGTSTKACKRCGATSSKPTRARKAGA